MLLEGVGEFFAAVSWPDAVVGFVTGVIGGWLLSLPGHRRARAEHARSVRGQWLAVATQIEAAIFAPDVSAARLAQLRDSFPLDNWRATLGGEHFRLLEDVVNAAGGREYTLSELQKDPDDPTARENVAQALARWREATTAFVNAERMARSEQYEDVLNAESPRRGSLRRRRT